mgnify:CR=1 FL=1
MYNRDIFISFQSYHTGIEISGLALVLIDIDYFQSYHTGIEIRVQPKRYPVRFLLPIVPYRNWNYVFPSIISFLCFFQSYHTGIEISENKPRKPRSYTFQSYHTGIEICLGVMPFWMFLRLPIVPYRNWNLLSLLWSLWCTWLPIVPYRNWNLAYIYPISGNCSTSNRTIQELKCSSAIY